MNVVDRLVIKERERERERKREREKRKNERERRERKERPTEFTCVKPQNKKRLADSS